MSEKKSTSEIQIIESGINQPKAHLDFRAMAILIILCASWGLQQISIKIAMDGISPMMQAGIRSVGSTILLFIWMVVRREKVFVADGTLWWGFAVGILFAAEFILIYWGLEFTYASRSVIFIYTMPFLTAIGAHMFIPGERMRTPQAMGLCCAFLGILLAFSESLGFSDARVLIGDSMMLFAALLWASCTVMIKSGPLRKIRASKTLLYQLVISALILTLFSIMIGEPGVIKITPLVAGCVLYQVIWVAFITYLAWFWLINNYPASRISAFLFFTPLFGVLEGTILLNENLTHKLLIALILVCIGIYVVNQRHNKSFFSYFGSRVIFSNIGSKFFAIMGKMKQIFGDREN